jgi:beta-xylosidase
LFSDYSDPDVIRSGSDFYLVASTFSFSPGLPVLESPDLVHWTIAAHVLPTLPFGAKYDLTGGNRYGRGVWAPALREHAGRFYIFFPTPDEGIFMCSADRPTGPWSVPVTVIAGPGYEDPCPFWDDDGQAYLIHSRTGAGPLILHHLSPDATHVLDDGRLIVSDRKALPTLEGPKIYKQRGFYYIWAPFGGVERGSQIVLRSRSIWGPYEHRVVLSQGNTAVNGPHQGGYVEAPDGRGWFLHFQSRGAHGRIDWLEPVRWEDDWPVMGVPVMTAPMPVTLNPPCEAHPQTSDEFAESVLGQQWEWNHNPVEGAWSLTEKSGCLRLHALPAGNLLLARNTLTQQLQAQNETFTVRLELVGQQAGDLTGLAMFEQNASGLAVRADRAGRHLEYFHGADVIAGPAGFKDSLQLRVAVTGDIAQFSYSRDGGLTFEPLGPATALHFSWWKGSRPAVFNYATGGAPGGFVDLDWARIQ